MIIYIKERIGCSYLYRSQRITDRSRLFRGSRELLVVPNQTSPVQLPTD